MREAVASRAPRRARGTAGLAGLIGVVVALAAGPAAAEDPRRTVAVLELRSDSTALPEIGGRVAATLIARTSLRVLGDDQARQRYGAGLDADVVACGGEAGCIGRIGTRLSVDEVIMVGVSELGDVILTVQRVASKGGQVKGRLAEALPAGTTPSDDDLLNYLTRVLPAEDFVRFGMLAIKVNVAGADIEVGGQPRGKSPIEPIKVPAPATYAIDVRKVGYQPFHVEVKVPPDAEFKVDAALTRPGGKRPWYAHWYVAAAAGVVVAGAVTTTILVTRDRDSVPVGGHFE